MVMVGLVLVFGFFFFLTAFQLVWTEYFGFLVLILWEVIKYKTKVQLCNECLKERFSKRHGWGLNIEIRQSLYAQD